MHAREQQRQLRSPRCWRLASIARVPVSSINHTPLNRPRPTDITLAQPITDASKRIA
jgi:hypothetical protein